MAQVVSLAKCAFDVQSSVQLRCIVSKEGLTINLKKVKLIVEIVTPTHTKQLEGFLQQGKKNGTLGL